MGIIEAGGDIMGAKVYALDERKFVGKRCWFEMVGYMPEVSKDGDIGVGEKIHRLMEANIEFWPLKKNPSFKIEFADGALTCYATMEKYGECYVFWDGKPEEPYFKEGWPEWTEIKTVDDLKEE